MTPPVPTRRTVQAQRSEECREERNEREPGRDDEERARQDGCDSARDEAGLVLTTQARSAS
jgi:hypothetical protein